MITQLIFDRTQNDVDRVIELKKKFLLGTITDEEKQEYLNGLKGTYNATDLNRVGGVCKTLKESFLNIDTEIEDYRKQSSLGQSDLFKVSVDTKGLDKVTPKTDWKIEDIPTESQVQTYLQNITLIVNSFKAKEKLPTIPLTLNYFTFEQANDIEKALNIIQVEYNEKVDEIKSLIDSSNKGLNQLSFTLGRKRIGGK